MCLLNFLLLIIMCLSSENKTSGGRSFSANQTTISPVGVSEFGFFNPGQSLSGKQTIQSQGGTFELSFFSPGNSQNHYIGIRYKNISDQTVVWVANRRNPVSDPISSALKLLENGELVLLNQFNTTIWSTESTASVPNSTIAVLLDNGNFVIRDKSDLKNIIWQSFDHPTDTWLPGAKLGYNKIKHEKIGLSSWKSSINPAPGPFSLEIEIDGTNNLLKWNDSKIYWETGNWNVSIFNYVPQIQINYFVTNISYDSNENESYGIYDAASPSILTRIMLDVSGQYTQFVWREDLWRWDLVWVRPLEKCQVYSFCGAYGICNQRQVPICDCPRGFEPRRIKDWDLEDHSDGCVRTTPLECTGAFGRHDSFLAMHHMSFPVNSEVFPTARSTEECRSACSNSCFCSAYAYDNQCLLWKGNLYDLQQLSPDDENEKDFYLRSGLSDSGHSTGKKAIWIVVGISLGFLSFIGVVVVVSVRAIRKKLSLVSFEREDSLLLFRYQDLKRATKNFSKKVGEGGFGTVFKGTLSRPNSSTNIAVKMLKSCSRQDEKQFLAEVRTIGMIQHINLIRLHGFCAEGSRRFLVYDYMPNGSLESSLFGKNPNNTILDWKTRYRIAIGTAKALAYLHEDCRDCIIHCDIKPENILLDLEYSPKVSDFGIAKLIGRDFSRVLTTMRGTRGYLAPEWISGEPITSKVDVYSFGKLLFEIVSGRRNIDVEDDDISNYFPALVAIALNKGEDVLDLLDEKLEGGVNIEEVVRVCKVACWCIQDYEKDRPSMGHVVRILEGVKEVGMPPIPRFFQCLAGSTVQPTFYKEIHGINSSGFVLSGDFLLHFEYYLIVY